MDIFTALILGTVQGLTEFLPVSSSGHLVLGRYLLTSYKEPGVVFEAFLHAGTLFAILYYFRKEIFKLSKKYVFYIILATLPAALFGYLFSPFFEGLFESPRLVGFALLATGFLNLMTDLKVDTKRKLNYKNSIMIGFFQALAIIPGISRSGSTIFAGTRAGIKRENAAKFSFLLSVPAVLGANVLQFAKYGVSLEANAANYLVGFIFAFVAGYFAINTVIKVLKEKKFKYFAYYCFLVGITTLLVAG